jgi:hydrogenase nickel incorporation protein HypA/HybF
MRIARRRMAVRIDGLPASECTGGIADMHETAIVQGLMRILTAKAREHGIARIVCVRLRIGRLRGLDVRQVRGCFEIFAEATAAEGARLEIEEVGVEARCRACGQTYGVPRFQFECPACGSGDAEVIKGRELELESFDGHRASEKVPGGSTSPLGRA